MTHPRNKSWFLKRGCSVFVCWGSLKNCTLKINVRHFIVFLTEIIIKLQNCLILLINFNDNIIKIG